ncbi:hypothetical protein F4860DRAFT_526722 [Xylaria cubensis]|nr:hypothetical protein F4860DRAFT_526722 [Xylaria cubensis]
MKETLKIVGEHTNDYIQFYYGDVAWRTTTDSGPASCKIIGDNWDQNGPANCPSPAISVAQFLIEANEEPHEWAFTSQQADHYIGEILVDAMEDETDESNEPPDESVTYSRDEYSEDNNHSINDSAAERENDNAEDDE